MGRQVSDRVAPTVAGSLDMVRNNIQIFSEDAPTIGSVTGMVKVKFVNLGSAFIIL